MLNKVKVVLLLSLLIVANMSYAQGQKWKYLTKTINILTDEVMTQQLSRIGAQGWELVGCSGTTQAKLVCVFKKKA